MCVCGPMLDGTSRTSVMKSVEEGLIGVERDICKHRRGICGRNICK